MHRRGWILGALLALAPVLSQAAVFVRFEGIPGTVTQQPYSGWHRAMSYTWSLDRSNPVQFKLSLTAEQQGAGVGSIKQAAFNSSSLKSIVIDDAVALSNGPVLTPTTRLTCEEPTIRVFSTAGGSGNAAVFNLELACGKVLWEEYEYGQGGTVIKSIKGSWNFRTNTP